MKLYSLVFASLLFSSHAFAASAVGTSEVHTIGDTPDFNVAAVTIKGDAAKLLFNKLVEWGYRTYRCSDDRGSFGPVAIVGVGFGCQKDGQSYNCAALVSRDYVSADAMACPAPSGGVGTRR